MNEYDKCVMCNKETEFLINEHIDYRKWYVEGAGQLCNGCWDNIYGGNHYEEQKTILG